MRNTMRDPLPPLRPLSQGDDVDTPRGIIPKGIAATNPHFSSDFEVNRSLFLTVSSTSKSPLVQNKNKRVVPTKPTKLLPNSLHPLPPSSTAPRKFSKSSNDTPEDVDDQVIEEITERIENENDDEETDEISSETNPNIVAPELLEIQHLTQRIPDPDNSDFDVMNIYKITPVLDRILSTVTDFSPKYISSLLNHPIIQDLWSHLFALIDVDDFLLRTIICRILLSFAMDSSSQLLLPVSQIFYKLSCDQSNDIFFVEESLHEVLMSIIKIASPEARVYAASALKNISGNEEMREKIVNSDFLNLLEETINSQIQDQNQSNELYIQLIGTARRLCQSQNFRKPFIDRKIFPKILENQNLRFEGFKLAVSIPDLPIDLKLSLLSFFTQSQTSSNEEKDLSEIENIKNRFLINLGEGLEDNEQFLNLLVKTIREQLTKNIEDQDLFVRLLNEAKKCVEHSTVAKKIFEQDELFIEILNSPNADARVSIPAFSILKNLDGPNFAQAKAEFSMFDFPE